MNTREIGAMAALVATAVSAPGVARSNDHIDRHALVSRHNVIRTKLDAGSPLQVGNGEFAFGADITGLQTFVPFATMSHWGWHSFPLPPGQQPEEFRGVVKNVHGRPVRLPMPNPDQPELSRWLYSNPNRLNLGRLGLKLIKADGQEAAPDDIKDARQELDLWSGTLSSKFSFDGQPVQVETCCHPSLDAVAVRVASPLLAMGRLGLKLEFPYADGREFASPVGDWDKPLAHITTTVPRGARRADSVRQVDDAVYHVTLSWRGDAALHGGEPHHYLLSPAPRTQQLELLCAYAPGPLPNRLPPAASVFTASARHWAAFWNSGGAIDLSHSRDPRWHELERRIVLSQYLMAVNEAGSLPPQESGLVNNGWWGKFHMEMYLWHEAQYALWDRWPLLNRSLSFYGRILPVALARAHSEGYRGAHWPKMVGPTGRESPHIIHSTLMWQEPHPLFFAELDYRAHPTRATLEKWWPVVSATADFMASYAYFDQPTNRYVLGPPLFVVSENTDPYTTQNPGFELAYWRVGLRLAQTWRERLGRPRDAQWDNVLHHLSPLPQQDGLYVLHEGVQDMWTKWNFEHPALAGMYGLLPGDGVDVPTMRRTLDKITDVWQFDHTWGWDFPMLAMCAGRLGEPERAVDYLLHPAAGFQFNDTGLATGGPFPYFPANGALLYAVALMAAGWDGAPPRPAPGFPANGQWTVRYEGLRPAL